MNDDLKKPWWQPALVIFIKVTGWIAAPVVIALFLGKFLDKKFGTTPWIFLGLTAFAFILSMVGIIKETLASIKKMDQETRNK